MRLEPNTVLKLLDQVFRSEGNAIPPLTVEDKDFSALSLNVSIQHG